MIPTLIDVSLSSDLVWDVPAHPKGIYELHFAFNDLDLFDDAHLSAYRLAVEAFSASYPHAQMVRMAELDGTFSFIRTDTEVFEQARSEMGLPTDLVCAHLFSDYLHRLAAALPEGAVPHLLVHNRAEGDLGKMVWLFCKRRFEHFHLDVKGRPLPVIGSAPRIVSLPKDNVFDVPFFESLLEEHIRKRIRLLCVPEEYLNEHWAGSAEILYDPETIGEMGRRMLMGFEAAGGITKKAR